MSQIATVVAVTGTAFAVDANGNRRALKAGDILQKGEVVQTPAGSRVELLMDDGKVLAVAPEQNIKLDESVTQTAERPAAQDASVAQGTIDTVILALERGGDLSDQLEATAAGLGGGGGGEGEGSSFVTTGMEILSIGGGGQQGGPGGQGGVDSVAGSTTSSSQQ